MLYKGDQYISLEGYYLLLSPAKSLNTEGRS